MMNTILTIGGSDSAGCSGVFADLRTTASLGLHGAAVITAVTSQNTRAVTDISPVPAAVVTSQLSAVLDDLDVKAIKVGMVWDAQTIRAIAACLEQYPQLPVIVDPVLSATTGKELATPGIVEAFCNELFPIATLVTPNADEAQILSGMPTRSPTEAVEVGRSLITRGCRAVLIKSGHFEVEAGTDVLVTPSAITRFPSALVQASHTRGTGCTLATAIACFLARDCNMTTAIKAARTFVSRALESGYRVGSGEGPVDALGWLRDGESTTIASSIGRFHVITNEVLQSKLSHLELARLAAAGGADVIQYRDKRPIQTSERIESAQAMMQACRDASCRLVVNDRADVARAVGAHGVHLGTSDLPSRTARAIMGPTGWVGATANNLQQAIEACETPIDYLGVGPVFGTRSKANPAARLDLTELERIVSASRVPVIAIGGIKPADVADVMATGAHGIAILSGVCCAPDPSAAARTYADALETCISSGIGGGTA